MVAINTISRKKWIKLVILAGFAVLIWVFSLFPNLVERFYTYGIYPGISLFLRLITRLIPFSIGDILYAILFILLIVNTIKWGIWAVKLKFSRLWLLHTLYVVTQFCVWAYIIFKLLWGLNYNRLGISYQLGIDKKTYSKEEIIGLTNRLIDKVNECRRQLSDSVLPSRGLDSIYRGAYQAYQAASYKYGFLNYRNRSVKASFFSTWGSYMGFTGYFNPFTGEAQVRSDIPRILLPYITCHEMAHQLGYGSESEANFAGYLAASASSDVYFRYSVYLDLLSYAQGEEIYMLMLEDDFKVVDSIAKRNRLNMDSLVKNDRRSIREFFMKRKNNIAPAVTSMYNQYLKLNRQSEGVKSYDEVIGWLIAYEKKYGNL